MFRSQISEMLSLNLLSSKISLQWIVGGPVIDPMAAAVLDRAPGEKTWTLLAAAILWTTDMKDDHSGNNMRMKKGTNT